MIQHSKPVDVSYSAFYRLFAKSALTLIGGDKYKFSAGGELNTPFEFAFGDKTQHPVRFGNIS